MINSTRCDKNYGTGSGILYLYIVRHGETYGNINGDGFVETDLTPKGEEQVRLLSERFKEKRIDKIYTSPLIRAVKTAEAVKRCHTDCKVEITSLLLERGTAPDYAGLPENELKKLCPEALFAERLPLGDESPEDSLERAKRIINRIKTENSFDSHIMITAHGTFNTYLILAATGFEYKEDFNFSQENTGVTLIRYIDDNGKVKTKLTYMNDASHLPYSQY